MLAPKVGQRRLLAPGSRRTSGIGQRTLQPGSPSGGVNFFNAICRLLVYEGSFSTRLSDLQFSTDSFVGAESVFAGVGLRSGFSLSIDPLQLINVMVSGTAIISDSCQVGCVRWENAFTVAYKPQTRCAPNRKDFRSGRDLHTNFDSQIGQRGLSIQFAPAETYPFGLQKAELCQATRPKCRSISRMNSVTLDWLDMTVIFCVFAACALVGWLAACLMSRFEVVKPREPMASVEDAQRIEVTVVDRGWNRWRRRAGVEANRFQGSPRKILSLP